jgi:hypothetical protein
LLCIKYASDELGEVFVWDLNSRRIVLKLSGHGAPVLAVKHYLEAANSNTFRLLVHLNSGSVIVYGGSLFGSSISLIDRVQAFQVGTLSFCKMSNILQAGAVFTSTLLFIVVSRF